MLTSNAVETPSRYSYGEFESLRRQVHNVTAFEFSKKTLAILYQALINILRKTCKTSVRIQMLNCPLVLIDALHFMQDTVRELEGEISRLEKEKANLSVALTNAKSENSDG